MNKTAIKNFAVNARRKLIEGVTHKAYEVGITEDEIFETETFEGGFKIKGRENGKVFKKYELKQREELIYNIRNKGFEQVMEEIAYTWFNRFIALRFMEINNYLPIGIRVLSSVEEGKTEPDIIKEALNIDLEVDREIIFRLQDSNDIEDLYKYLLIKQCNQLGEIMPSVFEKIADYTELLLPDRLLAEGSVVRDLVEEVEEYDWKIELDEEEQKQEAEKGEHGIEIIGWLYQYYISEKKDEVFAGLRKNKKITKENIPAATQLFTPKWIVKYMVENSLGRLWLEKIVASGQIVVSDQWLVGSGGFPTTILREERPKDLDLTIEGKTVASSKTVASGECLVGSKLKEKWKYYLNEAEQEPEVEEELKKIRAEYKNMTPEDIKLLDPAMGSGHILVYAFDVLYDIYLNEGYSEREIPTLILEKNLYGLDICDRAGQLASFAVLMKARSKNRWIFRNKPKMNLCAIQESNGLVDSNKTVASGQWSVGSSTGLIEYFIKGVTNRAQVQLKEDLEYLLEIFYDAKEYGSILDVKEIDFDALENRIEEIRNNAPEDLYELQYKEVILERIPPLIQQAKIMSQKYDVVCTNPPYMGRRGMNSNLIVHIDNYYSDSKSDMFSIFIEACLRLTKNTGKVSMVTMHSWMFLGSYERLRKKILSSTHFNSIVHLGMEAFDGIIGKVVSTAAFTIAKSLNQGYKLRAVRLVDFYDSKRHQKHDEFYNFKNHYIASQGSFLEIPGVPIAYWAGETVIKNFGKGVGIEGISDYTGSQNKTANNEKYLRYVWEIKNSEVGKNKKWVIYSKGGDYRKHYGNLDYVVNWSFEARGFYKNNKTSNLLDSKYWYKEGITYTMLTTRGTNFRYLPSGCVFDMGGPVINYVQNLYYILGLLNSKVANYYLSILNPTINIQVKDIKNFPILINDGFLNVVENIEKYNVDISKTDWSLFETSYDFKVHPFLKHSDLGDNYRLSNIFTIWETETEEAFSQLKFNEEELNRIFIEIYGLQDEVTPEVEDKDITISKADRERDIKSFISYAVGCIFGRYSLDEEGLIYAGGDFDDKFRKANNRWEIRTKEGWKESSINIAEHNVIPIADGDYFEDDILERFVEFVRVSFGKETLEENLEYIAETLRQRANETSRQAIRRYFLRDFYKDHVRTYKKRPIYWLFDSGRQNGFKALIYMHRYNPSIVARVRTDYLHNLQKKYEAEVNHLDILIDSEISGREKAAARKRKEVILKQIQECISYDEVIGHMANQMIEIDLDDGVKVNYAKFQGVKIPQGEGKKPLKADLLSKI